MKPQNVKESPAFYLGRMAQQMADMEKIIAFELPHNALALKLIGEMEATRDNCSRALLLLELEASIKK